MTEHRANEDKPDAEEIVRLRGARPRVVRLSRKAVGLIAAGACIMIGSAVIFGLQPVDRTANEELFNTDAVAISDGVNAAPRDYSEVPRLGPPLPGDLGGPVLEAQDRGAVAALPPVGPPPPAGEVSREEAIRQRAKQEREAARESGLFVGAGASTLGAALPADPVSATGIRNAAFDAPGGTRSFLDRPVEMRTRSAGRLEAPATASVLQAGSIIPAALITGIRSDQPGLVTAQVTENVYDSLSGRRLLIPQGARLIGDYEDNVGFGERRVLLAWNRLMLPDGRSIVLERQPASDASGYAGIEDGVDFHWGGVVKAAAVSTLLGIGTELGTGGDDDLVRALRRGTQDSVNQASERIVSREIDVRPTLTVRPGFPVRVLVTRDLDFGDGP